MSFSWAIIAGLISVGLSNDKPAPDLLSEIQSKYSNAKSIKMEVEKELTLASLNKTKKSSGKLYLAPNGKFKLEITEPEKSLIVIDGKNIWVIQYPEEKSDKIQVMHSKLKEQLKSQVLLSFLMGQAKFKRHFKILDRKDKDGIATFKLEPKDKDTDFKNIKLVVDIEDKQINKISYKDTLENEISYVFKNNKFNDQSNNKIFTFKVPKNSEVSELK